MDADSLAPRRAVVTGGSNGIGAAIVAALTAAGTSVVNIDREPAGAGVDTIAADLANAAEVDRIVAELASRGPVDALVNCAGISVATILDDYDASDFDRVIAVNLLAPVHLMRLVGGAMAASGGGRIVNITSVHARVSEPGFLAYDIAKAGLEAATRSLAVEWADQGVLVNAVAPGFVATRMALVDGVDELERPEVRRVYVEGGQLPLGRSARPDEIAPLVSWLVGGHNTYLTGQVITIDGGLTVRL